MKKFYGLLLGLSIFITGPSFAQCDGVTVEAVPMSPQTGQYNYFGVRVTLAQAFSQDVTVTGYIYDDGAYSTDHPFTLTITANNLTAETSQTFYQTDPTAGAVVSIASVSPCPTYAELSSSGNIVVRAINEVTTPSYIKRRIELVDGSNSQVFGVFTNEIVPDNTAIPIVDQLQNNVFSGVINIKEGDDVLYSLRIDNGQRNDAGSILMRIDPSKCTWKIVRACVRGSIDGMNWVAYGLCLIEAPLCYGSIWASCQWDCLNQH